jgi:hypothetical protein
VEQLPAAQGNTLLPHEVQGIFSPSDKNRAAPLLDGAAGGGKIQENQGKDEETGG